MALRSFKTDESFLEKLAIGAVGTKKVIDDLQRQGHRPIELERGSTNFKIWKAIKIKRVRVPDILCIDSGIRVESRAKTKLTISMSHSTADETRGWNYGLKKDDFIALVVCQKSGTEPIDWEADDTIQYVKVANLSKALHDGKVIQEHPKGAQEGFETRLTWPASIASSAGKIISIANRIQFKRQSDNRTISLPLIKSGIELTPLVKIGQKIKKYQIIASVVPVTETIPKKKIDIVSYYRRLLTSSSLADRYSAAKAYSYLPQHFDRKPLINKLEDESEHIYVKLEAASALARAQKRIGYDFIQSVLQSDYLEHRLEAVIILGEIYSKKSVAILINVLNDQSQHEEIRSGAAWALGELNDVSSVESLVSVFNEFSLPIRIEAARSLKKIAIKHVENILDYFKTSNAQERAGISWALSKTENWQVADLMKRIKRDNLDMRQWAAFIMGMAKSERLFNDVERIREDDPELYFAVTVLWKITSSWVYGLKEY